jgi:hypothetical protein
VKYEFATPMRIWEDHGRAGTPTRFLFSVASSSLGLRCRSRVSPRRQQAPSGLRTPKEPKRCSVASRWSPPVDKSCTPRP